MNEEAETALFLLGLLLLLCVWLCESKQSKRIPQRQYKIDYSTGRPALHPANYVSNYSSNYYDYRHWNNYGNYVIPESRGIPLESISDYPNVKNLDSIINDMYLRYIALKENDFEHYYNVYDSLFRQLRKIMKEVDPYYEKYSSTIQFSGSHSDRLRIDKPNEFDVNLVIRLPINMSRDEYRPDSSDIVIEPQAPGFVQLKMGSQFHSLPYKPNWEVNKTAYKWMESGYLLRSKFIDWFKSVVCKTLNRFPSGIIYINNIPYRIRRSESGPAITLILENENEGFSLSIDLVPALRFPEQRWPISMDYRGIPPGCEKEVWLLVPKANVGAKDPQEVSRSWRTSLHEQERHLMYDSKNLRTAAQLLKKLRDTQGMTQLASYYIKTLFFLQIVQLDDHSFWHQSPATIFMFMVEKLYRALKEGEIPYFWNEKHNLISRVHRQTLDHYANKLRKLLYCLESDNISPSISKHKVIAAFMLTPSEFYEYDSLF